MFHIALFLLSLFALGVGRPPSLDSDKALSQFVVDMWSVEDGLPQQTVGSILQTHEGFLWLGTDEGLVRYNGLEFKVLDRDPAFASNQIISLAEDSAHRLWVGTMRGVVILENGRATAYPFLPDRTKVESLASDGAGGMWVGTWSMGLQHCNLTSCVRIQAPDSLNQGRIQSIVSDQGITWIGTDSGVYRVRSASLSPVAGTGGLPVSAMMLDAEGGLLISSREGGLHRLTRDGALTNLLSSDGWPSERIWSMTVDGHGSLWFGLDSPGVERKTATRQDRYNLTSGARVLAIHEDREGSVWLGIEGGGLMRFRNGAFTTLGQSSGLGELLVTPIVEDRNGDILAGTYGGGIHRIDPVTLSVKSVVSGLPSANITAMAVTRDGGLWVGTGDAGAYLVESGRVRPSDKLPSTSVSVIRVLTSGDLLIGTDEGLFWKSPAGFRTLTIADGLGADFIVDLLEAPDGTVWVATFGGGFSAVRQGQVAKTYSTEHGLASDEVSALYLDDDGNLWIGTLEGGLSVLQGDSLRTFGLRDGLFDHTVFQILEDDEGFLWTGSNRGISRMRKSELLEYAGAGSPPIAHEAFGTDDGLASAEIMGGVQPAGWKGTDGRLWFPSVAGLAVVNPNDLSRNSVPPPVVLERVLADSEEYYPEGRELQLPPGSRRLEFQFAALSLIDASAIKYRYRLVGKEETWTEASAGNPASFTYLDPGHYTFQVIAANNDGVWNTDGTSLGFYLKPYFYQTSWFWMLLGLSAIAGTTLFVRGRTRLAKQQRQQLEMMVEARTRDVMTAKDQIQAQSDALRDSLREKEVLLREVHHRVKNNLQMISSLIQLQAREVSDPDMKARFEECRDRIYSFSMVHERLYMAKDMAQLSLADYLKGLTEQLVRSHDLESQNLELSVEVDDTEVNVDRVISCGLIVTEFVSNAVRHGFPEGASGTIRVEFHSDGPDVLLRVEDNGQGLSPQFQTSRQGGLGLKLVEAMVARLGGTILVESRLPRGTRCEARFPRSERTRVVEFRHQVQTA